MPPLDQLPTVDLNGIDFIWAGTWNGDPYTDAKLDEMAESTNRLIQKGIYRPRIKVGHNPDQKLLATDEMPADGGVTRVYRKGKKIVADIAKVPRRLAQLIQSGAFPQRSAEIWYDGIDFEGVRYPSALKDIAFLGAVMPAVSSLEDVAARYAQAHEYQDDDGNLVKIVTLAASEPLPDELAKAPAFDGAQCPYCQGPLADKADESDCTCDDDCGRAKCPQGAAENARAAELDKATVKEGAPKSPPKGYPTDSGQYADPTNFKYPIDDKHINAAVGYFNHPGAMKKGGYDSEEWATIGGKIAAAANKLIGPGHKFENGQISTDDTKTNARIVKLAAQPSFDDVRYAVQDALQDRFPYVYQGDGSMPSGVMSDGPSQDIVDLYNDSVVVWDQDHDELWQLSYTMDDAGDVTLAEPVKVRTSYEPLSDGGVQTYADAGATSPPARANPLPHDPDPQGNRDTTTPRTSDQAKKSDTPDPNDEADDADTADGYAAVEKMLADFGGALDTIKGKKGVGAARSLHGLLTKYTASMKGLWPDIDKQGNTDGSEGPEGEDAAEQTAPGKGKDPPHGPANEMARTEADMTDTAELAKMRAELAELKAKELARSEETAKELAALKTKNLEREAEMAFDAAVGARKMTPRQHDFAVRMYSRDPEEFTAFVKDAPEVWSAREYGSAGAPKDPSTRSLSREEQEVARRMEVSEGDLQTYASDRRSVVEKAREANQSKHDPRYVRAS